MPVMQDSEHVKKYDLCKSGGTYRGCTIKVSWVLFVMHLQQVCVHGQTTNDLLEMCCCKVRCLSYISSGTPKEQKNKQFIS